LDQGHPLKRWLWIKAIRSGIGCGLTPLNALAQATTDPEGSTGSNQG
jgi:hypothetical protein